MQKFTYCQLGKDNAYWPEKAAGGHHEQGGHTAGLLTSYRKDGKVEKNILIDAGLGTIQALMDTEFDWEAPLEVLITHGHPDHHLELMILGELYMKRMTGPKEGTLPVHCTKDTYEKRLAPVHGFRFESAGGRLLTFKAVTPQRLGIMNNRATDIPPFTVHAIENDHFLGAVNYVIKFGEHKIFIGWDLRSLPDPKQFEILTKPSLALIEANTLEPSTSSGHISVRELIETGFLDALKAPAPSSKKAGKPPYGIYFVHFGGRIDESIRKCISDSALNRIVRERFKPLPKAFVGTAARLKKWDF